MIPGNNLFKGVDRGPTFETSRYEQNDVDIVPEDVLDVQPVRLWPPNQSVTNILIDPWGYIRAFTVYG